MQLRSGLLITSPACDILPSVRKRKGSFHTSPPKRRVSPKDQGHEGISPQLKSRIYHSSKSTESQFQLKSLSSPPAIQGNARPANSLSQRKEKYITTDEKAHLKRAPLTKRNLKIHSRLTMERPRKDLSIPLSKHNATTTTTTTDKGFGIQLRKNGIVYSLRKAENPEDITMVKEYLNRSRDSSSSLDQEDYDEYIGQLELADNELSVQSNAWPLLSKPPRCSKTEGYTANYNFQWTEVEGPLTFGLSDAKPDISESYRWEQYPSDACEALGGAIAPTHHTAAMPTLCVEWRGPSGPMPSAEEQCAYDGALMANAAYDAHNYMDKDPAEFFGKTQALTVALNGRSVDLYGNHVVKKASGLEYHQYSLGNHQPRNSPKEFKETRKRIRNAQDWARERATRTKDDLHTYTPAKEVASSILPEPIDEAKDSKEEVTLECRTRPTTLHPL